MRFFCLVLITVLFSSCAQEKTPSQPLVLHKPLLVKKSIVSKQKKDTNEAQKVIHLKKEHETLRDLETIPQNVDVYLTNLPSKYLSTQVKYEKDFFRVWNIKQITTRLNDALWANKAFTEKNSYGENLQKLQKDFFDSIENNVNYKDIKTLNLKAISLKELNIRAFPTDKPLFLDPSKAGEGFPFDYLQNSTIAPNKPLLVSHYSQDKEWAFIESSFTFGWVKSGDIVILDKKYTDLWQKAKQIVITEDGVPIYAEDGSFLFHSKIGMMLALIEENKHSYTVLTVSKYKNNKALYTRSKLSKKVAHLGILEFNPKNVSKIMTQLSKNHYGWGGFNSQRDCSSTLRDFYAPFGVWLPRNSYQQSRAGERISLEDLSTTEKIAKIEADGVPFRTLLYKSGHIVLYLGVYNNEIIIFQNVWGVKTKKENKEGRFIVGKAVFSTLELGKNLQYFDKNSSLLQNLKSMTKL